MGSNRDYWRKRFEQTQAWNPAGGEIIDVDPGEPRQRAQPRQAYPIVPRIQELPRFDPNAEVYQARYTDVQERVHLTTGEAVVAYLRIAMITGALAALLVSVIVLGVMIGKSEIAHIFRVLFLASGLAFAVSALLVWLVLLLVIWGPNTRPQTFYTERPRPAVAPEPTSRIRPPASTIRVTTIDEHNAARIDDVEITPRTLFFFRQVLAGESLAHAKWTGPGQPFSDPEYRDFTRRLERLLIIQKQGSADNSPWMLTEYGRQWATDFVRANP
jgi:hypothetical protein